MCFIQVMFSALAGLVLMGAPLQVPEVTSSEAVKQFMGGRVVVVGQLERVSIGKDNSSRRGTGLVLDDDTVVYVSYAEPPADWGGLVGARISVEGLLRPSLTEHEQSLLAPHLRDVGAPKRAARSLPKLNGARVRVSGVARNTKGGAVVLVEGSPCSLERLDSWPAEVVGKLVAVGGRLVERQYLPQPSRNAKGEVSQGAGGTQNVLEAPVWRLIEEPGSRHAKNREPRK